MPENSSRVAKSTRLQQRLQVVMDWDALGMWEVDLKSQRVVWTARAEEMLGLPPGQQPAYFSELLSFIHPEDRDRIERTLQQALKERWPKHENSFRITRADGMIRHFRIFVHFLFGNDGSSDRMIGVAQDVTEANEKDQELQDAEERLRITHETSKAWTWQMDLTDWTISRPFQTASSYSPQFGPIQTLQKWLQQIHPEDRARFESGIRSSIETGEFWEDEFRLKWPNGEYRWIYDRAQRIDRPGRSSILAGAAIDITERKQVEQQLIENAERLRSAYIAGKMWPWEIVASSLAVYQSFDSNRHSGPMRPPKPELDGFLQTIHPEDQEKVHDAIMTAIRSHGSCTCEFRLKWSDDSFHWVSSRGGMVLDDRGVWKLMGVAIDLEEQKRTVQALEESERLRLLALDAANMGIWSQDMLSERIQWSDRQLELFGLDKESFAGHREDFRRQVSPEDLKRLDAEEAALAQAHARRFKFEFRITRANDGAKRWIAAVGEFTYDDSGRPLRMIGVNYDVTEAKQSETALCESETFRRLAMGAAQMGAWEWDFASKRLRWSEEEERIFGFDPGTFDERLETFLSRVHPDDLEPLREYESRLLRSKGTRYEAEFRIVLPDESERWIGALGEVNHDENGRSTGIYGVNFDVTERKRANEHVLQLNRELQRKVEDFEALLRAIPVAVAVALDPESRDIRMNPAFTEMVGLNDLNRSVSKSAPESESLPYKIRRDGIEVAADELPQQMASSLKRDIRDQEFELQTIDGRRYDLFGHAVPIFDENGEVRGTVAAYMDITGRKRTERALRTGEKLATAGRMAASLAHEINNPLAAVTNLLYLIGQDGALSEASKRFVSMASSEVARVSHITRNMLAFYRETSAPVEVDLAALVQSVLELYETKIRESHVEVDFQTGERCRVFAFPGELRQVASNLVVNALEAMPTGGRLRIRVQARRDWRANRSGVCIVFSDSGIGIPRHLQARLFEPFFTTKGEKGTGLGLWVTRDIINKHDGSIRVRSITEGGRRGTCFFLFIPAEGVTLPKDPNKESAISTTSN
jgi:PAS domain S-box-containing protein